MILTLVAKQIIICQRASIYPAGRLHHLSRSYFYNMNTLSPMLSIRVITLQYYVNRINDLNITFKRYTITTGQSVTV